MAEPVLMPKQGQSVESCIITEWYKSKGDQVSKGDLLFAYETDKASFEEEAQADGTLIEVFYEAGDEVPVLTNVAVIGNEGESADHYRPGGSTETATEPSKEAAAGVRRPRCPTGSGRIEKLDHTGLRAGGLLLPAVVLDHRRDP